MSSPAAYLRTVRDSDGTAILDIKSDAVVMLNPTGGYVWERLQLGRSSGDIARELATEAGMDPAIVEADVREFVEQLRAQGLLED